MPLIFSAEDLDAMARARRAVAPAGLFNPGKVLPAGSGCLDSGARSTRRASMPSLPPLEEPAEALWV